MMSSPFPPPVLSHQARLKCLCDECCTSCKCPSLAWTLTCISSPVPSYIPAMAIASQEMLDKPPLHLPLVQHPVPPPPTCGQEQCPCPSADGDYSDKVSLKELEPRNDMTATATITLGEHWLFLLSPSFVPHACGNLLASPFTHTTSIRALQEVSPPCSLLFLLCSDFPVLLSDNGNGDSDGDVIVKKDRN